MQLIDSVLIKINQSLNAGFYGLILLLFTMCNADQLVFDDIKLPPYKPGVEIVIGETTYKMLDLVGQLEDPNIIISESQAGLLSVAYRDTSKFDDIGSIFVLQDISSSGFISPSLTPIFGAPAAVAVPIPAQDLSFDYTTPNNEELDLIKYSTGSIDLSLTSGFSSNVDFTFTLQGVVHQDTGDPMVISGTMPANGTFTTSESLVNYQTAMTRVGSANSFSAQFEGTINIQAGEFLVGTEQVIYHIDIKDADFTEIQGWFGDKTYPLENQTIAVEFFEGIAEDGLSFFNPQLIFYLNNSFGVPMGMNLNAITASSDTQVRNLTGTVVDSPQLIRAPTIGNIGDMATSIIKIDESNSNLRDLLNISPNLFTVDVSSISNYNNPPDNQRNFITKDSQVEIISEINLPFQVKLLNFSRDFDTNIESFDFEDADTIKLVLTSINKFPFSGNIDLQFRAADQTVLFQYPDLLFLESSEVPVSGKITDATTTTASIPVYRGNGYEELLAATTLNMVLKINSYKAEEDNYVKIFSDSEMTLKVYAQANINYEL